VGLLAVAQAIPYGRGHSNPPVTKEPAWDSSRTRELAKRACFDCHSNETTWPWYSNVAPESWLIQRDVDAGLSKAEKQELVAGLARTLAASPPIGGGGG
jgi:hypothetical protein